MVGRLVSLGMAMLVSGIVKHNTVLHLQKGVLPLQQNWRERCWQERNPTLSPHQTKHCWKLTESMCDLHTSNTRASLHPPVRHWNAQVYLLHKLPTWGPWDVEATRRAPISKSPSISWVTSTISSKVKLVFFSSKKRIHNAYRFQTSVLHALFNHWESLASFKKSWLIIKLVKMHTCNMCFNFMQIPPLVGHNVVTF